MIKKIFGQVLFTDSSVIFYSQHALPAIEMKQQQCIPISNNDFSIIALKKNPLRIIREYRRQIEQISNTADEFIDKFQITQPLEIVIGSDKDNFTQVFLNRLYLASPKGHLLHAVEEGIGYYVKENIGDKFKALLYRLLSPVLFNQKLLYHRQLGTDSRIDNLYVRLPDMLPKYKGLENKKIFGIDQDTPVSKKSINSNKLLIFSFPNADYDIDADQKKEIYTTLLSKFTGHQIYVKPHPREAVEVFEEFENILILDKTKVGEDLDYFDFAGIINFSSSVIIDILARNYPAERIFTIAITPFRLSFFDKTNCLNLSDLKSYSFEDTSQL